MTMIDDLNLAFRYRAPQASGAFASLFFALSLFFAEMTIFFLSLLPEALSRLPRFVDSSLLHDSLSHSITFGTHVPVSEVNPLSDSIAFGTLCVPVSEV
jgi:hypothetical protein